MVWHFFPPEHFCHHFLQRTPTCSWRGIGQISAYSTPDRQTIKVFFLPSSSKKKSLFSQQQRQWVSSYFGLDLAPDKLLKLHNFQVISPNTLSRRPCTEKCAETAHGVAQLSVSCALVVNILSLGLSYSCEYWAALSLLHLCESPSST